MCCSVRRLSEQANICAGPGVDAQAIISAGLGGDSQPIISAGPGGDAQVGTDAGLDSAVIFGLGSSCRGRSARS